MNRRVAATFLVAHSGLLTVVLLLGVALAVAAPAGNVISNRAEARLDLLAKARAAPGLSQELAAVRAREAVAARECEDRIAASTLALPAPPAPSPGGGEPPPPDERLAVKHPPREVATSAAPKAAVPSASPTVHAEQPVHTEF